MAIPPPGTLFYDPQAKPLSSVGVPMPGAYYLFFFTQTTTAANVYADGALTTPLSQTPGQAQPSCTADANGRFNPIYLNPSTTYRVQLFNSSGTKLEDVDPYVPSATLNAFSALTGTGTLSLTDGVNSATVNYGYSIAPGPGLVTLQVSNGVITSGSTTLVLTGLPTAVIPTTGDSYMSIPIENNTAFSTGIAKVTNGSSTLTLQATGAGATSWTASGTKGIPTGFTITYPLAGIVEL